MNYIQEWTKEAIILKMMQMKRLIKKEENWNIYSKMNVKFIF